LGSRDSVSRKNRDLEKAWTDPRIAADHACEIDGRMGCLPWVIRMNPKEEADNRTSRITDALVDAVIAPDARQRLAVIFGKKSIERNGARSNAVKLCVGREQLDSHAPQSFSIANDSHDEHGARRDWS
jgi:hypothetical protein